MHVRIKTRQLIIMKTSNEVEQDFKETAETVANKAISSKTIGSKKKTSTRDLKDTKFPTNQLIQLLTIRTRMLSIYSVD
jgi:hypothetical protein